RISSHDRRRQFRKRIFGTPREGEDGKTKEQYRQQEGVHIVVTKDSS
ncbi:MAG: hypothetical protein ACI92S_003998, partial [Planctomycetaceae bacterium]